MFSSHPVLKEGLQFKRKIPYYKVTKFYEVLPLAAKNHVNQKASRGAASSCTMELQALFGCLKKWEFDDKPCAKQHASYMDCVHAADKKAQEYIEAAKKGTLGENEGHALTTAQFNKLMQLFPQPDLGKMPYRQLKRLPTQSYADDTFGRKNSLGKPS